MPQRFVGMISVDGGPARPAVFVGELVPLEPGVPTHPIYIPPGSPGVPTHPIYNPPGIWGPTDPRPSHPIVIIPPGAIDGAHPEHPIYLPVYPSHPIELPPEQPPADPGFQWVYTDQFGWVLDPVGGGKPRPPGGSLPGGGQGAPPRPDQGLPTPPGRPDNTLPPAPEPKR